MTYDKHACSLPRYDHVREVKKWNGTTFGCNLCVMRPNDIQTGY